jgi:outer membrane lipase/esterase
MFSAPTTHSPALRRIAALTALACSALALNGCGGGSRATAYQPTRMVSFGDENSLIDTFTASNLLAPAGSTQATLKGLVYTVNTVLATTTGYLCADATTATANSPYIPCTSSIGVAPYVSSTWTYNGVSQWFVDAALASTVTNVQHDNSTQRRVDIDYSWSCPSSVLWTQYIAHAYGIGYANYNGATGQCPSDNYSNAVTYAAYGARAEAVAAQINNHLSEITNSSTLSTVMAGQWDILDLYAQVKAGTKTQADAEAELRGRADTLAAVIINAINQGAKVVVALTPDLGESPLAYTDGKTVELKALARAFNDQLYINNLAVSSKVPKGGRVVAGVNPETMTNTTSRSTSYVYAPSLLCPAVDTSSASTSPQTLKDPLGNAVTTATTGYDAYAAVKYCNTIDTTLAGSTSTYMWADQIHFSPLGHSLIGALGYSRSSNQF